MGSSIFTILKQRHHKKDNMAFEGHQVKSPGSSLGKTGSKVQTKMI